MTESITARVGRIISGGLNAIVDAMENAAPETVMEQAVREIDSAVDEVRAELGRVAAGKHMAEHRRGEENRRHERLAEQIRTAVARDRDDLAETGIAEQMDIEAQLPVLDRSVAEAADKERELEGYIKALQAKKRELKAELRRLAESRREVESAAGQVSGPGVAEQVARAESAFERLLERQTGIAAAAGGGDAGHAARLAELEELSRGNRIKERLAALKSTVGPASGEST
jgi:phage shock protein A